MEVVSLTARPGSHTALLFVQVPTSAANFVELEALRWENRKLSEAKATAETEVGT